MCKYQPSHVTIYLATLHSVCNTPVVQAHKLPVACCRMFGHCMVNILRALRELQGALKHCQWAETGRGRMWVIGVRELAGVVNGALILAGKVAPWVIC